MGLLMEMSGISYSDEVFGVENFIIKKSVYKDMIEYCRSNLPNEACGLLSGEEGTGLTLWKIKNEYKSPNRFYMSKESIQQAFIEMEVLGEQLTGIFHSHPSTPAFPSIKDIRNNAYPQLAYLIVSFYKGKVEVRCFKTTEDSAIPINLVILDETAD
ncbi:M67 family metallopeptidase [Neobacillus niacini]|uniref:M67 family metallopeptidase n=1 Tax=Neobacillus niacini TaxID=86668 RepID=UPI0028586442|nr:M67 family metallopeptidase [Neobacillus niacini]MDR7001030.1 proteasome lid subunit RPN8/RPN11 [Neobacillus niacini]